MSGIPGADRSGLRDAVYYVDAQLKTVTENKAATTEEKATAKQLHDTLHSAVEYAPIWVRM